MAEIAANTLSFNEASALQRRKRELELPRGPRRVASMRPPLFSGGNLQRGVERRQGQVASMRPPLFSGGNVANLVAAGDTGGFNEASALQRRKRVHFRVTARRHGASMRPPLFSGGNLMQAGFGDEFAALQ